MTYCISFDCDKHFLPMWKSYPNVSENHAYSNYSKYNSIYLGIELFPQSPLKRETYL